MTINNRKDFIPARLYQPVDLFLILRLQLAETGTDPFLHLILSILDITMPSIPIKLVLAFKILAKKLNLKPSDSFGQDKDLILPQVKKQKEKEKQGKEGCQDQNNL